ncbi:BREX-3 system P-loop-containing protein BrxF [Solibacillus silvestris]
MNLKLIHQLNQSIEILEKQYYKQIYIFEYKNGSSVKGFSEQNKYPLINVNLEISNKLQLIPEHRRKFKVSDLLNEIINAQNSSVVCLDYYEILFEPSLQQNPFELFKNISRNKILIIAWRGIVDKTHFIYAKPGHPEYKKYPIDEVIVIQ